MVHAAMVRLFKSRFGIIAVSPCIHSATTKAMTSSQKPTRKPIEKLEFQACSTPPSCSTSSKQIQAPSPRTTPKASNSRGYCLHGGALTDRECGGVLKRKRRTRNVTPPIGKLIQKHHLQVRSWVNTPPSTGP